MGPERLWTLGMHDGSVGSQGGRVSVHPLQFKSQLIVNRFGLDHLVFYQSVTFVPSHLAGWTRPWFVESQLPSSRF